LLGSPKIPEDVDKQAAVGRRWWPDWKNPVVWLLGFTFASNRQAVDCFRAALLVRRCASRAQHDRDQASSGRSGSARHMNFLGDFDTMAATSSGLTACTDWLDPSLSAHWRSRIPR
jgi:hypothetical protein